MTRAQQLAVRSHLAAARAEVGDADAEVADDLESAILRIDAELVETEPGLIADGS